MVLILKQFTHLEDSKLKPRMASSRKRSYEASFSQQEEEKDLSDNPPNFEELADEYPSFRQL